MYLNVFWCKLYINVELGTCSGLEISLIGPCLHRIWERKFWKPLTVCFVSMKLGKF